MDKLFAIKIKLPGGGFSDPIPISTQAEYIRWDSTHDLEDILGVVDTTTSIQAQINNLKNTKVNTSDLNNLIDSKLGDITSSYMDQHYPADTVLKKTDLQNGANKSSYTCRENINPPADRQYAVEYDHLDKLSVNVPWTDTQYEPLNYIWTGVCSTESYVSIKEITLDSNSTNPSFEEENGIIIAVYFTHGNTAQVPKIKINNVDGTNEEKSIYYFNQFDQQGGDEIEEIDIDTSEYLYQFGPGLKFFTYYNNIGWLLTSPDYSLVQYLLNNKADLDSPTFIGTPKTTAIELNPDDLQIAPVGYVNEIALKNEDLVDSTSDYVGEITDIAGRQYAVVKDYNGKLSVNVPWTTTEEGATVQKIWTGICNTESSQSRKQIILDGPNGFNIKDGVTIIIYFTYGNIAANPQLSIGNNTGMNIYYQDGTGLTKIESTTPFKNWGPGLKIFTYYNKISESNFGWIIQSVDFSSINYLIENINTKANLNSPNFSGNPTVDTPTIDRGIANKQFVQTTATTISETTAQTAVQIAKTQVYNQIIEEINQRLANFKMSHIGMIIHSTTLDTQQKVKNYYGGTHWIQHSGYFLQGATSSVNADSAVADGGSATHNHGGNTGNHTLTAAQSGVKEHTHTFKTLPAVSEVAVTIANGGAHSHDVYYVRQAYDIHGQQPRVCGSSGSTGTLGGGAKSGGSHSHTSPKHKHTLSGGALNNSSGAAASGHNHPISADNNLPPYKNVYIWERVS